ncbi:MAG: transposase [Haliscomenobacter sp.]|nr:transposase [Haliscomenobacter sp.]
MGGHKIRNQQSLHYVTITTAGWVDLFTRKDNKDILLENLAFYSKHKKLTIYAYVIMTNHLHLILSVDPPYTLSGVLRDFKKYTATKLLEAVKTNPESRREWLLYLFAFFGKKTQVGHQIWQHSNAPIELASPNFILQKLNYIHFNPVRAGWVNQPEHFLYSSASNYLTGDGVFEVTLLPVLNETGWVKVG